MNFDVLKLTAARYVQKYFSIEQIYYVDLFNFEILRLADENETNEGSTIYKWRSYVQSAQTVSRLYVLMEILDSCVAWDKSIDNVVSICKHSAAVYQVGWLL